MPSNALFLLGYGAIPSLLFVTLFPGVSLEFLDVYPFVIVLSVPALIGVGLHDRYERYKSRKAL
ncbi:MAG: hypothetical protein V4671_29925 [Armatimonadota bacterium]